MINIQLLDSEEYLNAVESNQAGNMFEFWDIISDGIIRKINLKTINARELKECKEEIESELAGFLTIHNTNLSDEQIKSLQDSIEVQTSADN